jgi:AcrR family transcriptional regulator
MTSSGSARPGGRTARTAQAVFAATRAELAARPYADISIETIAARAGVHKTTVYRRWRAKPELVVDALSTAADARIEVPDTGSVESDLRALSRAVQATLSSPEGAATTKALCAAALTSPEIAGVLARFWRIRLGAISTIVERAIERGELPEHTDAAGIFEAVSAPLYYRLLVTGAPLTVQDADRNAAAALVAARAGVFAANVI